MGGRKEIEETFAPEARGLKLTGDWLTKRFGPREAK